MPKLVEGRPRVPDRQALCGILFVLHTGIQWEYLPQELGFGSGMTCRRRPAAWGEAGARDQLHVVLPEKLRSKDKLNRSRAVIDSSHVRAARRGPKAVPARSTAHGRAASTTSSSTGRASRSRCRRPAETEPAPWHRPGYLPLRRRAHLVAHVILRPVDSAGHVQHALPSSLRCPSASSRGRTTRRPNRSARWRTTPSAVRGPN
ncbi:transposase [Streptomyces sp. GbtcB7]|uniref:transposase n=1 Tax=Streptomyces sp. GbtcB7 TaxID=2824752 RepID=UPI0034D3DC31